MPVAKRLRIVASALGLSLMASLAFSREQPPFEVKDPAISENFREIFLAVDEHSAIARSGANTCIDNPTLCVDATENTVSMASTTVTGILTTDSFVTSIGTVTTLNTTTLTAGNLSLNLKSYGAVGDGSTNDYAAIQSAVNACSSLNGELYFPAGIYISTAAIIVKSSCVWTGAGRFQSIISLPQSNISSFDFSLLEDSGAVSNWTMKSMGLRGNRPFQTSGVVNGGRDGGAIFFDNGPIDRITLYDISVSSFGCGGGNCLGSILFAPDTQGGATNSYTSDVSITNSIFSNNQKIGAFYIDVVETNIGGGRNIFFNNNTVIGGGANNGVYYLGGYGVGGGSTKTIVNSQINNNNFHVTERYDSVIEVNGTHSFTINNNNYFYPLGGYGHLALLRSGLRGGSFSHNNVVSLSTETDKPNLVLVAFDNSAGAGEYQEDIQIIGNTIAVATATTSIFKILAGSKNIQVKNNIFKSTSPVFGAAAEPFSFAIDVGESQDVDIEGNQFENGSTVIRISEGTNPTTARIRIKNNKFNNCGGSGTGHIATTGGTFSLTDLEIEDNIVTNPKSTAGGAGFAVISPSANTNNTLRNNKIYGSLNVTNSIANFSLIENNLGLNSTSRLNTSSDTWTGTQVFQNNVSIATHTGTGAMFFVGNTTVSITAPLYAKVTQDNDSAPAGYPGETLNSNKARSEAIKCAASTACSIATVTLTGGHWLISAAAGWRTGATTTVFQAAINTTANAFPTGDAASNFSGGLGWISNEGVSIAGGRDYGFALPSSTIKVAAGGSQNVYLVLISDSVTNSVFGFIEAVRIP